MSTSSPVIPPPASAARLIVSLLCDVLRILLDVALPAAERLAEARPLLAEVVALVDAPVPAPVDGNDAATRQAFDLGRAHVARCAETGSDAWSSARVLAGGYSREERHALLDGVLAALDDETGR